MAERQAGFVLPVSIISPTDIARLKRELESIEGFFQQSKIREGGQEQPTIPRMSKLMDQLAVENKLNMLQEDHRAYVLKSLDILQSSAPVMHVSFSVDPPGSYVQKIVYWLRTNIHAQVLVTVGLQPNIGAGCVVRTTNRIFDFSLREYFNAKRDFFIEKMHEAISDQPIAQPVVNATPKAAAAVENNAAPVAVAVSATASTTVATEPAVTQPQPSSAASSPTPAAPVTEAPKADSASTQIAVNVVASSGGLKQ